MMAATANAGSRSVRRRLAAFGLGLVVAVAWLPAPSGAATTEVYPGLTEFDIPTPFAGPSAITKLNGELWFAERDTGKITRSTTTGVMTEYTIPTPGSSPRGIAAGPDGNIWFTETLAYRIGKLDPSTGDITEIELRRRSGPHGIAAGPDGNLWVTLFDSGRIARVTTAGVVTEFRIPTPRSSPDSIVRGPDGAMWFTEHTSNKIGRITTDGTITEFDIPTPDSRPHGMDFGPDGALWFVEEGANKVARMALDGSFSEFPVPQTGSNPHQIAAGPDGNMWYTAVDKVGRVTPAGVITEFPLSRAGSFPTGIVRGPDNAMWFAEFYSNKLARLDPAVLAPTYAAVEYEVGSVGGVPKGPSSVAFHPGTGDVWFAEMDTNGVGRLIPSTGQVDHFATPTDHSMPCVITVGGDGNLWVTEAMVDKIGVFSPTGVNLAEYALPIAGSDPHHITTDPTDGSVWFTELLGNRIGHLSLDGQLTEYKVPTHNAGPDSVAVTPDGMVWFTELKGHKIGRLDPRTGQIDEFPTPTALSQPHGLTVGPTGQDLYFTEELGARLATGAATDRAKIGRITLDGVITELPILYPNVIPHQITSGPDGNLWITQSTGHVTRYNPVTGAVTDFPLPTVNSGPAGLTAGPDAIWVAEYTGNKIAKIPVGA